jgi:3-oxoacyl-[acyl-carrier-protein] synthase II
MPERPVPSVAAPGWADTNGITPPAGRVVITGLGPITAAGIGVPALWDGIRTERSPIRGLTRFDPTPWRSRIGAEVEGFEPNDFMDARTSRRFDRFSQFAIAAARLALDDAGLDPSALEPDRVAVQMGSALGGIAYAEEQMNNLLARGIRGVDPRVALTTFAEGSSPSRWGRIFLLRLFVLGRSLV